MKYIFALSYYNYVCCPILHVDHLLKLEYTWPDVYKEFCNGHFVINKTKNPFSSLALDQAHEQNNAVIKGVGDAIGSPSQDVDATLQRWEIAGPEVVRLLNEYEKCHHIGPEIYTGTP